MTRLALGLSGLIMTNSIQAYENFIEKFDFKGRVIYPCCGYDYQPSEVFKDIVFIDKDRKAVENLRKRGLKCINEDVKNVKMDCDLLILISPSLFSKDLLNSFTCKFILSNNLHGTADELRASKSAKEIYLGIPDYYLFEV